MIRASGQVRTARAFDGTLLHRIAEFLISPEKGTTLHNLTRSAIVGETLRFPDIPGDNPGTAYKFHLAQLAAGPAIAVHQPLYRRWQRSGSLTRKSGWQPNSMEAVLDSQAVSAEVCLGTIENAIENPVERNAARY